MSDEPYTPDPEQSQTVRVIGPVERERGVPPEPAKPGSPNRTGRETDAEIEPDKDVLGQLDQIVSQAEQGAEKVADAARREAAEKIAEAERVAEMRIRAAENEAAEIIRNAQVRADFESEQAEARVARAVEEATAGAELEARKRAASVEGEAAVKAETEIARGKGEAKRIHSEAQEQARALVSEARAASSEAKALAEETLNDLDAFADALRSNAERMFDSLGDLFGELQGRLEELGIDKATSRSSRGRSDEEAPLPDFLDEDRRR